MMPHRSGRGPAAFIALALVSVSFLAAGWFLRRTTDRGPAPIPPTRLFEQVLGHIRRYGVDSLSEAELFRRATAGLMRELDDEYAAIRPAGAGGESPPDVGGLGLLLSARGGRLTVLGVLPDSPADRAGLRAGDQILEVDARALDGSGRDEVLEALDGAPGSRVRLQVRRPVVGQVLEYTLERARPREFWISEPIDLGRGVWYLGARLLGPGASREARRQLRTLRARGARGLVLDLRGASGGRLSEGIELASMFLPEGVPIVTVQGREGDTRGYTSRGGEPLDRLSVVVVVSPTTADAAEVVAAALQDHDRALVVGRPSYGRGVSPEEFSLDGRMVIRLSTARWRTPSGRGIQPDSAPLPPDSLAGRPVFRTFAGREVLGGGGVVPDSVLPPVGRSEAEVAWLRGLDTGILSFEAVLREVARELAQSGRVRDYRFQPSEEDLAEVRARLEARDVRPGQDLLPGAAAPVRAELGDLAVREALGYPGLLRRQAEREGPLRFAVALLRATESPAALLGLAAADATARRP